MHRVVSCKRVCVCICKDCRVVNNCREFKSTVILGPAILLQTAYTNFSRSE